MVAEFGLFERMCATGNVFTDTRALKISFPDLKHNCNLEKKIE